MSARSFVRSREIFWSKFEFFVEKSFVRSFRSFVLLARFARVKFLKFCVEKWNWNVFENLCQFSGFQVVYSERTLRLTDFETTTCTTWSQSTLSESLAESTKVYTWSQSTDRLTSRLRRTTWSRSTGLPGKGWEASHKFGASVDVSKTHRFEFCNLFPIVLSNFCPNFLGWILKTFPGRNSSQNCTQLILLWEFIADISIAFFRNNLGR